MTWTEAFGFCAKNNHTLVIVNNYELETFLMTFVSQGDSFWAGGSVFQEGGEIVWLDGVQWNYTNYEPNYPGSGVVGYPRCVYVRKSGWRLRECENIKYFMCEYEREPPEPTACDILKSSIEDISRDIGIDQMLFDGDLSTCEFFDNYTAMAFTHDLRIQNGAIRVKIIGNNLVMSPHDTIRILGKSTGGRMLMCARIGNRKADQREIHESRCDIQSESKERVDELIVKVPANTTVCEIILN